MQIYTTHICYEGKVGVTSKGEYYELSTATLLVREYHQGAIYYRAFKGKKRYSWKKCNETKQPKVVEIIDMPF
jgi:hypothetical protein